MKKLERMLLMNWHNFSLQVIPFEMITFLTGKNSSGKSTIIDAMQLVLLGDTSGTFFNKAANQKSTRTLQSYLFGEQGDDGEAGFMYKRSGHFMTYVALEFHDTELNSYFTASFAAECYKDRSFSHRKALKVLFYSFNSEAIKYVSENADLFTVATDNKCIHNLILFLSAISELYSPLNSDVKEHIDKAIKESGDDFFISWFVKGEEEHLKALKNNTELNVKKIDIDWGVQHYKECGLYSELLEFFIIKLLSAQR